MKKLILFAIVALSVISCSKNSGGLCNIHGTVSNPELEGKCIYLIAFDKSIRDSVGIDSAFIKDGKFEIQTPKNMIGILRMDYRYRYGTEELLVVEEPGDVFVHIDTISYGKGTKNNDIIQEWKDLTTKMHTARTPMLKKSYEARHAGDQTTEFSLRAKADSLFLDYMKQTRGLAEKSGKGPLHDFLLDRIPSQFTKNKADGTTEVVTP